MSPAALIASSAMTTQWSARLVEARHGFADSQAAALEEIGEQIAAGVQRFERSRSKVVYLFDSVKSDPMRNRLAHRAVVQADRRFAAEPVAPTGWGEL